MLPRAHMPYRTLCTALTLMASTALPLSAQDLTKQKPLSDLYAETDAQSAYEALTARWVAAEEIQFNEVMALNGDMTGYVPKYPALSQVTWPYDTCTDVISLVPPPLDGWAVETRTSWRANPVSDERAEVSYVAYDGTLQPHEDGFHDFNRRVTIRVSARPEKTQMLASFYNNETLRDQYIRSGPYNYPIMTVDNSAMLGIYEVTVSSGSDVAIDAYLQTMIGCGIANGLISEVIDPDTLTSEP